MSEHCFICDHTDSGLGANYLFRFRAFNPEAKTQMVVDCHLRCVPAMFVDRQHCIFQCIGRVRDILEAERIARVEAKRLEQEETHTFEEPTDDEAATEQGFIDNFIHPEGKFFDERDPTNPPAGDQPHLRLLA